MVPLDRGCIIKTSKHGGAVICFFSSQRPLEVSAAKNSHAAQKSIFFFFYKRGLGPQEENKYYKKENFISSFKLKFHDKVKILIKKKLT